MVTVLPLPAFLSEKVPVEDTVTWSGYRTGHRDGDYRELRDFAFDRQQYEQALRSTAL